MNKPNVELPDLLSLFLQDTPLIDVRAPCEYQIGHLPNSINLPILTDEERAQVGTTYKKLGGQAAIELGQRLVSGEIKEKRIKQWVEFVKKNPTCILYCFRGGLRSQITQQWLKEAGITVPLIVGGYKISRQFLLAEIERIAQQKSFLLLSGSTGSHKTHLLQKIKNTAPVIDLEGLANHRGSAFGGHASSQPSQVNFENQLALQFLKIVHSPQNKLPILIEDESRNIGRCIIPQVVFKRMRESRIILINEPILSRVENIFQEYIAGIELTQFAVFKKSLQMILKKLGAVRYQEILALLEQAEADFIHNQGLEKNKLWIERLLTYYYDPMYLHSLENRNVIIEFQGTYVECFSYCLKFFYK